MPWRRWRARPWRCPREHPDLARARLVDDGVRPGPPPLPAADAAERGPWGGGRPAPWDWPQNAVEVSPEELADADVDVVVLQRPEEAELAARWLARTPGRDVPAVYLEHNAPRGPAATTRHPFADRDDVLLVHVTRFNALMWDAGSRPPPLWSTACSTRAPAGPASSPAPRSYQRARAPRPHHRHRPAARPGAGHAVGRLRHRRRRPDRAPGCDRVRRRRRPAPDRMHAELARRAAYVHTARWTSLGLSLIEAMLWACRWSCSRPPSRSSRAARGRGAHHRPGPAARRPADARRGPRRGDRGGAGRPRGRAGALRVPRFLADWDTVLDRAVERRLVPAASSARRARRARREGADPVRIAMVSEHASPLAAPGSPDAGGQNVHVSELSRRSPRRPRGHRVHPPRRPRPARAVPLHPGVASATSTPGPPGRSRKTISYRTCPR